jgi:hypothetical protein
MSDRPKYLYKYRSLDAAQRKYVERIFTHRELYFPSRTSFNDPFDCRATLTMDATKQQFRGFVDRILRKRSTVGCKRSKGQGGANRSGAS